MISVRDLKSGVVPGRTLFLGTMVSFLIGVLMMACSEPVSISPGSSARQTSMSRMGRARTPSTCILQAVGGIIGRACNEIEDGAKVNRDRSVTRRDGSKYQIPPCAYLTYRSRPGTTEAASTPADSGWMEWAYVTEPPGSWYSQINANWTVPAAPQRGYNSAQTYFSFPGVQSDSFILQPVLQYGYSAAGGGNTGPYASWQCDGLSRLLGVHSTLRPASDSDAMTGSVAASACSAGSCTWTITTT